MTEYTIVVSCPELSLSDILFRFDLPPITVDGENVDTKIVEQVYNELSNLKMTSIKSALLAFLQSLI